MLGSSKTDVCHSLSTGTAQNALAPSWLNRVQNFWQQEHVGERCTGNCNASLFVSCGTVGMVALRHTTVISCKD